jgi:hypothetical protein
MKEDRESGSRISRRQFGLGVLASAGVVTFGEKLYLEQTGPAGVHTKEASPETYDEETHSGYFNADVERFSEQFERDMPVVLSRQAVLSIIEEHFHLPKIDRPRVRTNLERLIFGIAIAESRLDPTATSEVGAFGCMQIMPETWAELASPEESKDSLVDTIAVSARLIEQSYRHITTTCAHELAYIQRHFFADDITKFEDYFLTPLLANAYNAGMGTMALLLSWFVTRFPDPKSTCGVFEQSEVLTEYDVFIGLAHTANNEQHIAWYKDNASNYTTKAYSAFAVLQEHRKQQSR